MTTMTTYKVLTDKQFIEEIIQELDAGWVQGSMCDDHGKCLVGAGAAVLGFDYSGWLIFEEMYSAGKAVWDAKWSAFKFKFEGESETRLQELFEKYVPEALTVKYNDAGDVVDEGDEDMVVEEEVCNIVDFNDGDVDYVTDIRPKLIEILEKVS